MQNLLAFISRFSTFLLFLFIQIICFTAIIRYNSYQRAGILNSANWLTGTLLQKANDVKKYINLSQVNDSLANENRKLYTQIAKYKNALDQQISFTADSLSCCNFDTSLVYNYISAKVINNSITHPNNYLTINKGKKAGIKPEMGVVCSQGVVGVVKDVSDEFATVISVLHRNFRMSAKIKRNDATGSLRWDQLNPNIAILDDVPRHISVTKGDTVLTTGYSSFFPSNVIAGVVQSVELAEGNFFDIKVRLSTNFSMVQYVYVIDYSYKNERQALEEKSQNE